MSGGSEVALIKVTSMENTERHMVEKVAFFWVIFVHQSIELLFERFAPDREKTVGFLHPE